MTDIFAVDVRKKPTLDPCRLHIEEDLVKVLIFGFVGADNFGILRCRLGLDVRDNPLRVPTPVRDTQDGVNMAGDVELGVKDLDFVRFHDAKLAPAVLEDAVHLGAKLCCGSGTSVSFFLDKEGFHLCL